MYLEGLQREGLPIRIWFIKVRLQYYPEVATETFKVLYGALSRPLVVDNHSSDCTTGIPQAIEIQ